jgi:uncharacterized membrane protein
MLEMIAGLLIFLLAHSIRIFAEDLRKQLQDKWGHHTYKVAHALISLLGFLLIVKGYPQALADSEWLWQPPIFTKHLTVLLMLFALILLVSTYVPNNHIKARLKHPMILSVKVWALGHLIANAQTANVIVFVGFLMWAVLDFRAARQRDRATAVLTTPQTPVTPLGDHSMEPGHSSADMSSPNPSAMATLACVVIGFAAWAGMILWLHFVLFGVYPIHIPGVVGNA